MSRLDQILALPKVTHNLVQGSPEWAAFRLQHDGASEAAAMLGLSKKVKRSELMHAKHTGLPREFSDWLQKNILDRGHEVEALARPHVEALIGDELYPVTCSRGRMSASCDGLSMDDRKAMEHKQWAEDLAAMVAAGVLPDEHWPQCQQVLLVTGAEELYFVVSDGTPQRMEYVVVRPEREKWAQLVAGWDQFNADRAAYEPPAATAMVVAGPVQALPAVTVLVEGSITVRDNFAAFEVALRDFLEHRLIREPKTDQDFADLDVQIKAMKGAEAALDSAEGQMLAQIQTVDQAKKTKDMLAKLVRDNRLMAEKLLASEKERRRGEIVAGGVKAIQAHIDSLNTRLGHRYMPTIVADFAGCIKGLKSLASMEDKVATELARLKIGANEIADRIDANLKYLREHAADYRALFPDTAAIVQKAPDDLQALVTARIAEHRAAEERRAAELAERERARIRAEEEAKATQAAREKNAMALQEIVGIQQQVAIATLGRAGVRKGGSIECIRDTLAETEAWVIDENNFGALTGAAQAAKDKAVAEIRHLLAKKEQQLQQLPAAAPAADQYLPSSQASAVASPGVVPIRRPAAATPPTLRLGVINERLKFCKVTADDLAGLGFPAAGRDRSAVLFHEADFPRICDALVQRIAAARDQQLQAA